ncbi:hypothetical protein Nepgr_023227 [Nepenthes gracilis]|uniref:Uncharacterized protein n=1 Tax=Nepenthes gracilis TaxID=150966 RepID=A0AAD3T216_NEPGR|nr:hypothetical protein Nepgr_023227 [Nepenthes gracilis]
MVSNQFESLHLDEVGGTDMLSDVGDISRASVNFAVQDDSLETMALDLLDSKVAEDITREVGITITDLSSSLKMNLVVRDDKGSYPDLFDNSSNRNGVFSELNQPPSGDAGIPKLNIVSWDA